MNKEYLEKIINLALDEDLRDGGDITSKCVISPDENVKFAVNAREDLILCCQPIAQYIFDRECINYELLKKDGDSVKKGDNIIIGDAPSIKLLPVERVLLNFIQHLSGVATITRKFVEKLAALDLNTVVRDTRKTTPGMRDLEKYAVSLGGGQSYRSSLSEKILIKDNHIVSCGGIANAVLKVRNHLDHPYIAVECDSFQQLSEVVPLNINMALLDNMTVNELNKCVKFVRDKKLPIKLEASGNINLDNVTDIAKTGVDYISIGILTHSAPSKDIGIDIY
jgi:nicotinate-nucleotide pyrophosphorylase (carboxylating)